MHAKSGRIDERASTVVKQMLQEACCVAHKNLSELLLDAGINTANHTLADRTRLVRITEKWKALQPPLDKPVTNKPCANRFTQ